MKSERNDLSIIVYSCWKNADMWRIFITLLKKYWPDCAYPVVLLTDQIKNAQTAEGFDDVVVLAGNWHDMLFAGLDRVKTEYVMLWMDDYLLCDYVRSQEIALLLEKAKKYHAANICLDKNNIFASMERFDQDGDFYRCKPGTAYAISTQPGIWDVCFLRKYIAPQWSVWDFERIGSLQIREEVQPILIVKHYCLPYEEGVRRGKWMDGGVKVCYRNRIDLDFRKRKRLNGFQMAWIYVKRGILECNPTLIVRIQNCVNGLRSRIRKKHG